MPSPMQTTIPCTQCRQPVRAALQSVVDVGQDPHAKAHLLSGRLNTALCPNCGTPNAVLMPILYHDPAKELLIAYVPMELGMTKDAQEKAIGDLMREVTSQLPQGAFKAYLLQPRQALTMQGLIDQVLQADGVTQEALDAQRTRVKLIEQFLQASDEELPELIKEHDAAIDAEFFQTMTLIAQQFVQEGRRGVAQRVLETQAALAELSSFGKQLIEHSRVQEDTIQQVAEEVNALGQGAGRDDFLKLAIRYAEDEERLQALVGLVRPVFDYTFFQELTVAIGQAPAAARDQLEALRDRLLELTAIVDQQAEPGRGDSGQSVTH
jgi:hypothetical protein